MVFIQSNASLLSRSDSIAEISCHSLNSPSALAAFVEMICQNLVVEGTDEVSAEILNIIDLRHFQQDILYHVDVRLQHFGLYNSSWEFLTSERGVRQSGTDLIYDKADNDICFFVMCNIVDLQFFC